MTMSKDWYNTEFEENELESKHRPPSVEYSFYTAVKTGDMETVLHNCNANSFTHLEGTGILSRNAVTNLKYHFVVTAAMLTRYCIDGGMESEQAYRLSDFYILKMDSCTTQQQIADLHHSMAKDFTGKMALQKKSSVLSKPISKNVLPSKILPATPVVPRITFQGCSSKIWEFPSVTTYGNRK